MECPLCTNTLSVVATVNEDMAPQDKSKDANNEQKNDGDGKIDYSYVNIIVDTWIYSLRISSTFDSL